MCAAGEWQAALNVAVAMLNASNWEHLGKLKRADMRLDVAKLYWKNKRFCMSLVMVGRAVALRPKLVGRPVRMLLQRLKDRSIGTGSPVTRSEI